MKYIVLTAATAQELEKIVNQKIKTTWQPLGGVQLAVVLEYGLMVYYFAQAMTLNE